LNGALLPIGSPIPASTADRSRVMGAAPAVNECPLLGYEPSLAAKMAVAGWGRDEKLVASRSGPSRSAGYVLGVANTRRETNGPHAGGLKIHRGHQRYPYKPCPGLRAGML